MSEVWGVLAAVLSSGTGGTAIGATRYLVNALDPLAIGSVPVGIRFLPLLAGRLVERRTLAGAARLAGDGSIGGAVLCAVPDPVQCFPDLHHGGARRTRAID